MKKITVAQLGNLDACPHHIIRFKQAFGKSAYINKKNFIKALNANIDVRWGVFHIPEFQDFLLKIKPKGMELNDYFMIYLKDIPEHIKKRALKAMQRIRRTKEALFGESYSLDRSFDWGATAEGYDFWMEIHCAPYGKKI